MPAFTHQLEACEEATALRDLQMSKRICQRDLAPVPWLKLGTNGSGKVGADVQFDSKLSFVKLENTREDPNKEVREDVLTQGNCLKCCWIFLFGPKFMRSLSDKIAPTMGIS